MSKNLATPKWV